MTDWYSEAVVRNPDFAWECAVSELKASGLPNNVLLGFTPEPLYVPVEALNSHCYIVGPSEAGKTSRQLAPIAVQLIAMGHPVWVVDCKPDPLLWGHCRDAALRAGRQPNFFSLQPGIDSQFNVDFFEALRLNSRTPGQVAELLIGSLSLHKASEGFFVSKNAGALREAIARAAGKGRVSFRSIAHEMKGLVATKQYEHASHALEAIAALAEVDELNPSRGGTDKRPTIDFVRLVEQPSVNYFCLPVASETKLTSSAVASLLLKLLAAVSKDLAILGHRARRVYFAIDEFQDVASAADLKDLISQVRGIGGGISLLLAHQVQDQVEDKALSALLHSAGVVMLMAPRSCARVLQEWSGEKVEWLASESESVSFGESSSASPTGGSTGTSKGWSKARSRAQIMRPALDLNVIQDINALPGFGITVVRGGKPQPMFFPHHVPKSIADRHTHQAFAALASKPATMALPQAATPIAAMPPRSLSPASPSVPLRQQLQRLFAQIAPRTVLSKRRTQ